MSRDTVYGGVPKFKTFNGFGTANYKTPYWIKAVCADWRVGQDSLDWFFRGFNRLRLYENFFRTMPRFLGFAVTTGMLGTYYWGRMWDAVWRSHNKGSLYKDCPYVYPREEED